MADKIKFRHLKDLPPMTVSFGNTLINKTGEWRSLRPVMDTEKCTACMICWKFCPEACITPGDPPVTDLNYCKGCGICAEECPNDAITLIEEWK